MVVVVVVVVVVGTVEDGMEVWLVAHSIAACRQGDKERERENG